VGFYYGGMCRMPFTRISGVRVYRARLDLASGDATEIPEEQMVGRIIAWLIPTNECDYRTGYFFRASEALLCITNKSHPPEEYSLRATGVASIM
jgi:hypothetical protein